MMVANDSYCFLLIGFLLPIWREREQEFQWILLNSFGFALQTVQWLETLYLKVLQLHAGTSERRWLYSQLIT